MKEKFMVVQNYQGEDEVINYVGDSELEAYSKYKKVLGRKNILKAYVKFIPIGKVEFISSYKVIEVVR